MKTRTLRATATIALTTVVVLLAGAPTAAAPRSAHAGGSARVDERLDRTLAAQPLGGEEHITLDGVLDEEVWERAALATDFTQQEPQDGQPAHERTEVRVAYDAGSLYLGVRCEIDPAHILTTSLVRDFAVDDSDTFGFILDPFNDRRNGFMFVITPDGAIRDVQVMNDGANLNADWNVVWDVRTRRTADGWTAEVVLPFKSLRFPEPGGASWGMNFNRRARSRNEMSYWRPIPRPYGISRVSLAGQLTGLGTPQPARNLKVTPYVLGKAVTRNGASDPTAQLGGDIKYGLGTTTTLDLTLNTDFSQVETDTRQVNLTRFPLYYPEQRPFFLENADLFHFGIRPNEKTGGSSGEEYIGFFSRRIGLAPDGTPLPLWGGARLTGRSGQNAFGLLQVSTREQGSAPTAHFTVARAKRNIFGHSDVGAIAMNRQGVGGDHSRVVGGDLNLQFGRVNVTSYLAKSFNPAERGRTHATKVFASYADRHFDSMAMWLEVGEGYDRTLAYVPRRDMRKFRGEANWHWRPKMPIVREWHPHMTYHYVLNGDSQLRTKKGHWAIWVYLHDGSRFEVFQERNFDRLDRPFEIARGVFLPIKGYTFNKWITHFFTSPARVVSARVSTETGQLYSGTVRMVDAGVTARVRPRFFVEGRFERSEVKLPEGAFVERLATLRLHHAFSTRQFLDVLVQYNSQDDVFSYQARYNLIHRPLSDLFIVLNERREYLVNDRARSIAVKFNRLLDF